MFGGQYGSVFNDETWEWNGVGWRKRVPLDPEGDGNPVARAWHTMVYDTARGKTVLYGGKDNAINYDDLWEWDGVSWAKRCDGNPAGDTCPSRPSARYAHAMAYDRTRGVAVLFGGYDTGYNRETWEWDGTAWTQKFPTDPEGDGNPNFIYQHVMAFDSIRAKTLLFGGFEQGYSGMSKTNEVWEWDGTSWAKRGPSDPEGDGAPQARWQGSMAFDAAAGKAVLFGGWGTSAQLGDTWLWNGESWAKGPTSGAPAARSRHAMAYQAVRQRVLLFGGESGGGVSDETWEWDGGSWEKRCTAPADCPSIPTARSQHTMAYDSYRDRIVLFGGIAAASDGHDCDAGPIGSGCTATWEWGVWGTPTCGSAGIPCWKDVTPSGPNPPTRGGASMAYDPVRRRTVLFGGAWMGGGRNGNDTWEWDGTS